MPYKQRGEKNYLLEILADYFPYCRSQNQQTILSSFTGVLVLPKVSNKASKCFRETIFKLDRENKPRLLSIYGGKLTGCRATTAKVAERLACASLPQHKRTVDTRGISTTAITKQLGTIEADSLYLIIDQGACQSCIDF